MIVVMGSVMDKKIFGGFVITKLSSSSRSSCRGHVNINLNQTWTRI